jgi:hypothetical protein
MLVMVNPFIAKNFPISHIINEKPFTIEITSLNILLDCRLQVVGAQGIGHKTVFIKTNFLLLPPHPFKHPLSAF